MDFFSGLVIAGLIGRTIWEALKESPEEKNVREREERIRREQIADEEEKERKRLEAEEAERKEREKPFETSLECFQKQYVSYARIATYNSCPHRFKLIYLDKKSRDEFRDRWNEGGKVFHEIMEYYFRDQLQLGRSLTSGLEYKEVIRGWQRYFKKVYDERRKNLRKRVRFACRTFPKNVEIVAVEKELSFKANNINFYGIVDLVLKYPDGTIEIVDYKTGLGLPVKEQLEIYSIPFTQYQDFSKVDFRVICPDRQSHYRWSLDREKMTERRQHILGIVNTIINDINFTPSISSACSRCSVGYACQYSEIYKETKQVYGKKNKLTRLTSVYEWKKGVMPPKIKSQRLKSNENKTNKRKSSGSSYSYSQAKNRYECFKTRRPIQVGEYHFVNRHGKRFCVDAFKELYPEIAKQVMEKRKEASVAKRRDILSLLHYSYVGSSFTKLFHRSDKTCGHNIWHGNLIRFNSRAEAIDRGYKPCAKCNP